jgi:hypothetical protein
MDEINRRGFPGITVCFSPACWPYLRSWCERHPPARGSARVRPIQQPNRFQVAFAVRERAFDPSRGGSSGRISCHSVCTQATEHRTHRRNTVCSRRRSVPVRLLQNWGHESETQVCFCVACDGGTCATTRLSQHTGSFIVCESQKGRANAPKTSMPSP